MKQAFYSEAVGQLKNRLLAVSASGGSSANRGAFAGSRRGRIWRGGLRKDVHRVRM